MIERAYIHVGGPAGAGKTSLVEAVLASYDGPVLVARCLRDDTRSSNHESAPRNHPELRRYRQAGASNAALFEFNRKDVAHDDFFMTYLMADYSDAVIVEGDNPLEYVDLDIFVVPAPAAGQKLLVQHSRSVAAEVRRKRHAWEKLLRQPDGVTKWMDEVVGLPIGELLAGKEALVEETRTKMLEAMAAARRGPRPTPVKQWAIADRYRGVEDAGLVVLNIRDDHERKAAERLLAEVARLREDEAVFKDVFSWRGSHSPITAVAADISDPRDAGTRKALARIRRSIRAGVGKVQ